MRLVNLRSGRNWGRRGFAVTSLVAAMSVAFAGVAYADNIQDNIVDSGTGVTLVAGSPTGGTATVRVVGNNADSGDDDLGIRDDNCNWDTGESALVLDVVTPSGVTATPNPLSINACGVDHTVTFKASASAISGTATVSITSTPAGGGGYNNQVSIPITVTQPAPTNTKPSVTVTGVTDGASYEIGSVPEAGCSVTDAQDGPSSHLATVTGTLSHGLGTQTATCNHTDTGGLTADTKTATYTIVDTGDPTIAHTLSPASPNGSNGWYTSDVTVDFTCTDIGGSGIQSCTGDTTLGNGANQSATGTATDWAGNTDTDTVTGLNVDGLAPNAPTASLDPAPNGDGWNNSNVTVSFAGNGDNGSSGVDTCTAAVPVTAETAGQTVSGTCTDVAGNVSAATAVTVKLDKNGPTVSYTSAAGTPGNDGWYLSPVTATFTATDGVSGPASQTGTNVSTVDGGAVTIQSPAFSDTAGNTTAAGAVSSPAFKIDTEAPSVGAAELTGTLGSNGWYRSDVTASFTATDYTSGVAGTNPQTVTSSQQGEGIVLSSPAFSDVAGNTTPAGNKSATVKVDSIAPSVSLQGGPSAGTSYYFGSVPAAPTCDASDTAPGSGLAGACSVGGYDTSVGSHVVSATVKDNAGNETTVTRTYTVLAWTMTGFYAPVDKGVHNTIKGGNTVPLKFELFAGPTEMTDVSLVSFSSQKVTCDSGLAADGVEVTTTASTNLRYDATGGQFIQNWKTPTGAGTCWRATMTADDGSTISALFRIK